MSTINISIIFLIFGLTLETSELKDALKNVKVWVMGLLTILVITSFTAFIFVNMGFEPYEFGVGLAVFACSPTSLSSAITLVIQSYGNGAMSLLLTVVTNLLGIITTPLFVAMVLGPGAAINKSSLLVKLLVQILVPLLVGKGARELIPPVFRFAKKYKVPLYLFNNFQIIMIVWQTLSYSRHKLVEQRFYDILLAIMGAIGQHFFFLVMNFIIAWVLRFPDAERKAYVLSGSQKSLPTAAVVIEAIDNPNLNNGLITIPCMVFYIMQLFIDAFIANSWAGKYERADALREKYADALAEVYKLDDPESAMFLGSDPSKSGKHATSGGGPPTLAPPAGAAGADKSVNGGDEARLIGAGGFNSSGYAAVPNPTGFAPAANGVGGGSVHGGEQQLAAVDDKQGLLTGVARS